MSPAGYRTPPHRAVQAGSDETEFFVLPAQGSVLMGRERTWS